ncbi:class I SAM-dependent methyltransferase [Desulfosporosinus sp. OT]|uniref:class I SAM-dependent methyltransferase n=1 Tax=Desulfosporosinus sp. OT TaxID=913865 RepID=UPI00192BD01A|nr:class I SAM-dependent methyltransferase [Desulfosporosinus sp. OT]
MEVYECMNCGLVSLSDFSHISSDFYENSGMFSGNKVDIEESLALSAKDDERRFNYLNQLIINKNILDFGCGFGGFLRMAKKIAKDVKGVEPNYDTVKSFFLSEKLTVFQNINEVIGHYDVITLFHVLEHLENPRLILSELALKLRTEGVIIIEVPNADDALLKVYENEAFSKFTYWSCHLFLYNNSTLSQLAKQVGLKVKFIKQIQRYPLSNHLYWLSKGKPGGHEKWHFIDSVKLNNEYENALASIGCCDTIIACFEKG